MLTLTGERDPRPNWRGFQSGGDAGLIVFHSSEQITNSRVGASLLRTAAKIPTSRWRR
jgi:hypothetical protein